MPPPENPKPNPTQKPSQGSQEARQGDPKAQDDQSTVEEAQVVPAASQEAGKPKKFDESVPGGAFEVDGRMVDAFGKPPGEKKK